MSAAVVLQRSASRLAGGLIRRVHYRLLDRNYDRRLGADTAGALQPDELTIRSENVGFASEYAPTPTRVFQRVVASLPIDFRRFVFVDLGSGKGRTLLLAANLPFLRIEGVEFAAELHDAALRNIASLADRGRRTDHIIAHHGDAARYRIPQEPCVIYLYNPFGAPVLDRVIENLESSYRDNPRPIYVVYVNPKLPHLFERRISFRQHLRSWGTRMMDRLTLPEGVLVYRTGV